MLLQLLTAPVSLPMAGFRFILERVLEMAEQELMDIDRIREQLLELNLRLDENEISEEEFFAAEAELMARLRAARAERDARSGGA